MDNFDGVISIFKISVVQISVTGKHTESYERNVVKTCLTALTDNGYLFSLLLILPIQALHEGNPDVATLSKRIARHNENEAIKPKWC